jgi:fido (protein-threonine AMPylation protein)
MVQVETSQLASECNSWRDALRKYRDEFSTDNLKLQHAANPSLSKDQLQEVEHLHNQFHIQLINIHDLKHLIKVHHRLIEFELKESGQLREETLAKHENIFEQYQNLDLTLQDLRTEFDKFLQKT